MMKWSSLISGGLSEEMGIGASCLGDLCFWSAFWDVDVMYLYTKKGKA